MGRGLITMGTILVLSTVTLWVADVAGWVSAAADDHVSGLTLKVGLLLLGAGFLLKIVSPMRAKMGAGRCVSCGRPVLKGHLYCQDHLRDSVNAWRDQTRETLLKGRKGRA